MTERLRAAIAAAEGLSPETQDQIAAQIEAEAAWESAFEDPAFQAMLDEHQTAMHDDRKNGALIDLDAQMQEREAGQK